MADEKGNAAIVLLVSLGKAAIGALPGFGGPISSLLGDVISRRAWNRLKNYIHDLEARLRRVEMWTDDPFATLLMTSLRTVSADHRDFKRALLLNVLEDAETDGTVSLDLHQFFADLIDGLEPHHIVVLRQLRDRRAATADGPVPHPRLTPAHPDAVDFKVLRDVLAADSSADASLADDLAHEAVSTLGKAGLVASAGTQHGLVFSGSSSLDAFVRNSEYRLTPLGLRFVSFLADERVQSEAKLD